MPKTGIEPVSPRPQRGVLTTILLGPKADYPECGSQLSPTKPSHPKQCPRQESKLCRHGHNVEYQPLYYFGRKRTVEIRYKLVLRIAETTQNVGLTVPYKAFSPKTMPKTGIEPVSPRPQHGVLTTILLGPKA
ncbi:hypothetical protein RB195_001569 [Necator americanus]|uniref:Uncharacterized protein n=1 Tax=Necator americanus TaxID=51031 RepID=A0ABR1DEX4_NECAM